VPEVFDEQNPAFAWTRKQLATVLSPAELTAARRTTINAHYTNRALVHVIWDGARQLGFAAGQVLEPGCGSGNFIGLAPEGARMTGVELDSVTAGIAAVLYPNADVRAGSFAEAREPDGSYDLVIGNVPFGKIALHDRRHNRHGHSIHNHFILKSLHMTRPGGLVMVLTSRYTMDARNPAARREMVTLADLVGAIRLPSGAHRQTAGTEVVTDLLVLRRREPGQPPEATAWEQTRVADVDGAQIPVNEYFLDHPAAVLGDLAAVHGAYGSDDLAVRFSGDDVPSALGHLAATARERGLVWTPATTTTARPDELLAVRSEDADGCLHAHPDGSFTRTQNGAELPHEVPRSQARELRLLLRLRDVTRSLLSEESASAEDTPQIAELRTELNRCYDGYLQTYGPLNRYTLRRTGRVDPATGEPVMARIQPLRGGFRDDPYAPVVLALEDFEPAGQRAAKAAIFRERVIAPRAPQLGAEAPADALAICLDTRGEVSLPEIGRLLGTAEDDARVQLGTLVFDDPQTGQLIPAAEYLSGNVRDKLRAAEHAAADDPRFTANVAALRAVLPADLTPGQIDARLGAAWITADHVQQFLRDILDDDGLQVEHPGGQVWAVRGRHLTVLATSTWGTSRYPHPSSCGRF